MQKLTQAETYIVP